MASVLIAYGALLAIFSFLLGQNSAQAGTFLIVAGLAGAVFCAAWGAISVASHRGRAWPVLVLIALTLVYLGATVNVWWESFPKGNRDLLTPVLLSFCFLCTLGVLAYLLYAERPPSFWTGRRESNPAPSRPTQSN
jgi:hypothetical protein